MLPSNHNLVTSDQVPFDIWRMHSDGLLVDSQGSIVLSSLGIERALAEFDSGQGSRNLLLLQALCEFINAGGTVEQAQQLVAQFCLRVPTVEFDGVVQLLQQSFDMSVENFFQLQDGSIIRSCRHEFTEKVDDLCQLDSMLIDA